MAAPKLTETQIARLKQYLETNDNSRIGGEAYEMLLRYGNEAGKYPAVQRILAKIAGESQNGPESTPRGRMWVNPLRRR